MRAIEAHGRALGLKNEQIFNQTPSDTHKDRNFLQDRAKASLVAAILWFIPPALANEAITEATHLTPYHIYQELHYHISNLSESDRRICAQTLLR